MKHETTLDPTDLVQSFEIAKELVKRSDATQAKAVELSQHFAAACLFLKEATDKIPEAWLKFTEDSKQVLEDARLWRMAMEREVSAGLKQLKDMNDFLGSEQTKQNMKNMRELIELAERLQRLKASGFLDAMTDTILKFPSDK